jgi:DNA transposition AAA+ family ATPase
MVEKFLISEAMEAGVIQAIQTKYHKNPNRWAKHMAPWFNAVCREARREYKAVKREHGKKHTRTREAYQHFKKVCKRSRARMQTDLPKILKH